MNLLKPPVIFFFLVVLGLRPEASAQMDLIRDLSLPIIHNGEPLTNAFVGGLTAPQISRIDVDLDGDEDLFLFDRDGTRTLVFINEDSNEGSINYRYAPEYSALFPDLRDWVLLRDFDCDGDKDIFTSFQSSVKVYRNISTEENGLSFELASPQIQCEFDFGNGPETFPLLVLSIDLPSITDYDGDGDLDIVTFTESATTMYFFEGQGADNGDCGDLSFKCTNRCYGMASEAAEDNNWIIGDEFICPFNVIDPRSSRDYRHTGGTLTSIDLDDNGILDLIVGDVTFNNMSALYMQDAVDGQDSTFVVDESFPEFEGNTPIDLQRFPAAFYEDIDNDGVNDLIIAPNTRIETNDDECMWLYLNNGTNTLPDFELVNTRFLQDEMIELGRGAYPVLFDYNADGLKDLVIANKEYYESVDVLPSQLALYENTGTSSEPAYTLIDLNWLNIPNLQIESIYPTFGDLDGDGDDDLVLGEETGIIHLFENTAGEGNSAEFTLSVAAMQNNLGEVIDVGQFATPQLVDVDDDGLFDLIIGEKLGTISWYKNTGTSTSWEFTLQVGDNGENFGGVQADNFLGINGYSVPFMMRDGNGELALFIGNELGTIQAYTDISGNLTGTFIETTDALLDLQEGDRCAVWIEDIDADGLVDMFYGIQNGGLIFFRGNDPDNTSEIAIQKELLIFPNPVASILHLKVEVPFTGHLEITDLSGRLIMKEPINGRDRMRVDSSHLSEGVYILNLNGSERYSTTFIVHRN